MEEYVGELWHKVVTRAAGGHYPEAAVTLKEIEKTAGILFRAFGGDAGLRVAAATTEEHGARRRWLQRIAGTEERATLARLDAETLRLPPEIDCFPEKSLNRDLYLWLAALAACDDAPDTPWYKRNQSATVQALARFPGIAPRYRRLVNAHLAQRLAPEQMPEEEAAQERTLRQALQEPGSVDHFPLLSSRDLKPPQPIPLWLVASAKAAPLDTGDGGDALPPEGGGSEAQVSAHKAEQVEKPKNDAPMLIMWRAESLLSWAEYVRVNRAFDEDEDENAGAAAKDMDKLSVTRDQQTAVSKVKFDLDLPSAAEDDAPIGEGILLPEWDYRKNVLLDNHCRLQPMIARDAEPQAVPEHLKRTAHKLRQQFAALAPARRWMKAQPDGPELDIDACVRNISDRASGHTPDQGAYLAQQRCERDLACLLLADLSLSTDAWISDTHRIVDVIRESLLRSS